MSTTNGIPERPPRLAKQIFTLAKKYAEPHRFPTFCAVLIGGWAALYPILAALLRSLDRSRSLSKHSRDILASYVSAFISSLAGIRLLNSREKGDAGRTLELTLFTVIRAVDVLVGIVFRRREGQKAPLRRSWLVDKCLDEALFCVSSAIVMFAWFYRPEALPPTYNRWISDMGQVDPRLLLALKKMREGTFVYGVDTGERELLASMCRDVGMPEDQGDPALTVPMPCKLVHEGRDISCERNALSRGKRGFQLGLGMYLTINILTKLRNPSKKVFLKAFIDAVRSATFISAFISFFWYGVCLTRTRIGPKLFPKVTALEFDRDWIVKVGCLLCGPSIFFELPQRRAELAFFVAPKAASVALPSKYDKTKRWREELTFAVAAGILVTAARREKRLIRGVFGRILGSVVGVGRD